MSGSLLTTRDVAALLEVHPSTAKRWCDDGALAVERTDGGHRRIRLDRVLELARDRGEPTFLDLYDPYQSHVWAALQAAERDGEFGPAIELAIGWLLHSSPHRIAQLFMDLASRRTTPLAAILDGAVRGFLVEVGSLWAEGKLRTGDEHVASAQVLEALIRLRPDPAARLSRARAERQLTAIVGSAETNDHHLGATALCLLLSERGWDVIDLGPRVPVEDVAALQRAQGADLVCLSFSELGSASDAFRAVQRLAAQYTGTAPYALAIGGQVPEGDMLPAGPFLSLGSCRRMSHFDGWVEELETVLEAPS